MLASKSNGTLYVGVTNNLHRRMYEHKNHIVDGFTKQYDVSRLVYYEDSGSVESAIAREKQLKNWRREWKIALIEDVNPDWRDLADDFLLDPESSSG